MANQSAPVYDESFVAAADFTNYQFYAVVYAGNDTVAIASSPTANVIGILENTPRQGESALIRMLGYAKAMMDGSSVAIAANSWVGPNASGVLVAKSATDDNVIGWSLDAVSTADVLGRVMLQRPGIFRTALG